jgi:hypothetical protein
MGHLAVRRFEGSSPFASTRCRKHNVVAGNRAYVVSDRSTKLKAFLEPLYAPDPSDLCFQPVGATRYSVLLLGIRDRPPPVRHLGDACFPSAVRHLGQLQRHTGCDDSKLGSSLPMAEPNRTDVTDAWSESLAEACESSRGPPI